MIEIIPINTESHLSHMDYFFIQELQCKRENEVCSGFVEGLYRCNTYTVFYVNIGNNIEDCLVYGTSKDHFDNGDKIYYRYDAVTQKRWLVA